MLWTAETIAETRRGIYLIDDLKHGSSKVGTYRALIIGINNYKDPKIPDLRTPLNDTRAMADLLKSKYGFTVEMVIEKQATRKQIYNSLRRLAYEATPNDSVLIYYAGHGDLDRQYNDGWWIPYDATAGDPVTYFDNVHVQKAMRSMKARHVLLISDSCYSGTLFGQTRAMPQVISERYYLDLYNEKSRWGMTSGNKTPVADSGTGGHSIFAYQLIKALRNNDKPYISTQEIYTQIAPIVGNNSEQTPICRPILNTGDMGGEFVFIASNGAVVPDKPVAPTQSATDAQDLKRRIINSLGMAFVYIEPGTFLMGSPPNEPERDMDEKQHRVTLSKGFYMQTTEVTQAQWTAVMGSNPSKFSDCNDCPVEMVSWNDVQRFIRLLNEKEGIDRYRLPTEAEWEYAARAGTRTAFSFGGCLSTDQANYDGNYPMPDCAKGRYTEKTAAVASFPANAWGLYNMHGNVREWCQDWYGRYPTGSVTDSRGPSSGPERVVRGGGWDNGARRSRSAHRSSNRPGFRSSGLGCRLALDPEK
jgi:formylglycine-generating enzyme required for sulfatase activity